MNARVRKNSPCKNYLSFAAKAKHKDVQAYLQTLANSKKLQLALNPITGQKPLRCLPRGPRVDTSTVGRIGRVGLVQSLIGRRTKY